MIHSSQRSKNRLEAFPSGWFVLCFSEELERGAILKRQFMGQDIVAFRTASGQAVVSDAFCPHMGAHFAHGGRVEGETIRCPFHGFCFDAQGSCTKTGYGTKPPPNARLRIWETEEFNGILLVWHHANGRRSDWKVPALEDHGWSKLSYYSWKIRANPYDTAENAVDIGHFATVHGYQDVSSMNDLNLDGPLLTATYGMSRDGGAFRQKNRIKTKFKITKWGLGYSAVEVYVEEFGLLSRHFVFGTAINQDEIDMKIAVSIFKIAHPSAIHPLLALIPHQLLRKIVQRASLKAYKTDVSQDFEIWTNKTKIENPALAKGDGPIPAFRRWTKQFDPRFEVEKKKGPCLSPSAPGIDSSQVAISQGSLTPPEQQISASEDYQRPAPNTSATSTRR
ncbi:MAG: Rieske (2Fe-2S) protein [Polyangiaceae bacterium]|nr:Rieske (2Fe-2S) protein [Polyangiaceae bacterium]